jgi:ferredoxin--NADP+ reductase
VDARFSVKELEELGDIADVSVGLPEGVTLPAAEEIAKLPPAQGSMLRALGHYAAGPASGKASEIELQFLARPAEIVGRDRVDAVRFERMRVDASGMHGSGSYFDVPCGLVVSCIGYRARRLDALPLDDRSGAFAHDEARIELGLYCTGWARRGPSGTIATNRSDASQVAQRISREVVAGGKAGPAGLDALLAHRGLRTTSLADWRAIDRAECASAAAGAPRRKFRSVADMLAVLERPSARPAPLEHA